MIELFIKIKVLLTSVLVTIGFLGVPAVVTQPATTTPAVVVETAKSPSMQALSDCLKKTHAFEGDCHDTWIVQLPSGELITKDELEARNPVIIETRSVETPKVEPVIDSSTSNPVEKIYTITPPSDSPLKARTDITLEELRAYVIKTQYGVVAFQKKMTDASASELVDCLKLNGFTVEEN